MKLVEGKPCRIEPVLGPNDDDNVRGPGWHAQRIGDAFRLSYIDGALVGREIVVTITQAEFERLRSDPGAFAGVAVAHGG